MKYAVVVLAAGKGKRLKSDIPKVLHPLAGKPIIQHLLSKVDTLGCPVYMVVGHGADRVRNCLGVGPNYVDQGEPRGTGHAVLRVVQEINELPEHLLVLSGDVPFLRQETMQDLLNRHEETGAAVTVLTCRLESPGTYGRIIRDEKGDVIAIREFADAGPREQNIREINTGTYVMKTSFLKEVLPGLGSSNAQGEIYLTDAISSARDRKETVSAELLEEPEEMMGINTRADLAQAHRIYYRMVNRALMEGGVTLIDPDHTYIDGESRIGRDTVIYPGVCITHSTVGEDCTIHAHSVISGCLIGSKTEVLASSVMQESTIGEDCRMGPFVHLRPGCVLGDRVRMGNFVEAKNTSMGTGSKSAHLTYLGDAEIGAGVNIGCGTITCNYDGFSKNRTIIEDGAFIGSDTQLIAPVTIGKGAYIGSGSTINQDVPPDALGIARSKQRNIQNWARKKREKR